MKEKIMEALSDVYDPEMHIDIVSLGLIYDVKIKEDDITILMTLTFPGCPYGPAIVEEVEEKIKELEGVRNVTVEITFDPPWSPEKMDAEVKAALNL